MIRTRHVRRRRLVLAVIGGLLVFAGTLAATAPPQRTPPRSKTQVLDDELEQWRALVAKYRREGLGAIRDVIDLWPVPRLRRVADWIGTLNASAKQAANPEVVEASELEAAAVLHLDMAVAEVDQGVYRDAPEQISVGALFLSLRAWVRPFGAARSFGARWYQVAASLLLAAVDVEGFEAFLPQIEAAAPDDPYLWMVRGAYAELRASPMLEYPLAAAMRAGTSGGRRITANQRRHFVADAESAYRTSVRLDPSLCEGWLRLALFLSRHGRSVDALAAALSAQAQARDPELRYLGALVLGGAHADAGEWLKAEGAYRTALQIVPDCQAAAVGLSEVLLRTGRPREAATVLLNRIERLRGTQPDPWWEFQGGPYWRISVALDELRRRIRS